MQNSPERGVVLTASLTTGVVRIAQGMDAASALIREILTLEHPDWESILYVGDFEYHSSRDGPYPDHQMRVSVQPSTGYAALAHIDNNDAELAVAMSFNRTPPSTATYLVLNGANGSVFPSVAAIPVKDALGALLEWLETRRRPTCIEWGPL